MYFAKIPAFVQQLYPEYQWRVKTDQKVLYLTFDDGPTPEVTVWVQGLLKQYQARATFFVLGKNVVAYPKLAHGLLDDGHSLGNHSHTHPNGWNTSLFRYLLDFKRAQKAIMEYTGTRTLLFRPPYGRITARQSEYIRRSHRLVMMNIMPGDFDLQITREQCLERAQKHISPGSIICLHDSQKAWPHLEYVLPRLLEYGKNAGYTFRALNPVPELTPATR